MIIGLAGGAFPSWWVTSTYYGGVISREHEAAQKMVIEQQEQNRLALLAYAKRITDSGAQHDKNTRTIRTLNRELDGVRVTLPTCPVPGTTEGGADNGGRAGVAAATVDEYMDEAKRAIDDIAERCATLNIDAIRQNGRLR